MITRGAGFTFTQRDRILACLFAAQLITAIVFGGLLIDTLHNHSAPTGRIVSIGSQGSSSTATGAANPGVGAPGVVPASSGPVAKGAASGNSTLNGGAGSAGAVDTSGNTAPHGTIKPGAPITIGSLVTEEQGINFTANAQAMQAYIDHVDAQGGVNGHKINLLLANDQLNPNTGLNAAQKMINQGAFAFVGWNAPITENQIGPFLAKNKIPLVGGYGEYGEFHTPWAYVFTSSYGHWGFEMGKYLMSLGVKHPGVIYIDNQSADANNQFVNAITAGIKAGGGSVNSNDIYKEDATQPTYDNVVTSMRLNGVDGIATILDEASYNRLQQSMDRQGWHPIHLADCLFPDSSVKHESQNNGTYVTSDFRFINPSSTGPVADYVAAVKKSFGSSAQINYTGEQGWLAAEVFVKTLQSLGTTPTRSALMAALNKLHQDDGFGFTGPMVPTSGTHEITHCVMFGKWDGSVTEPTTNWSCDNQPR